jgi:RNA polymerase-binding transcription factor DksA
MNKHERAELKKIILGQLSVLVSRSKQKEQFRFERLETALKRVEAENFGACFRCEKPIAMEILRTAPERIICPDCLDT